MDSRGVWLYCGQQGPEGAMLLESDDRAYRLIRATFGCAQDVADRIAACCQMQSFQPRGVILRQGRDAGMAFLMLLGRAHAILYNAEGQLFLLHDFGPGDLFGMFDELEPYSDHVEIVAVDRVELLAMRAVELIGLAEIHSSIGLALTRILMRRLRRTTTRMYERAVLSANGRVYAELLRQAQQGDDMTIRPIPVVAELAVLAATTRETASRALSAVERRGIVERADGGLRVVAAHRLEELIF